MVAQSSFVMVLITLTNLKLILWTVIEKRASSIEITSFFIMFLP